MHARALRGPQRSAHLLMLELAHAIVETMADSVCVVRARDRKIIHADPKLHKIFGHAPGALDGARMGVLHDVTVDAVTGAEVDLVGRLERYGEACVDVRGGKSDGTAVWCRVRASSFDHPLHGPLWVLLHENITERKKADELRRLEEARFRRLTDADVLGIVTVDLEGRILEANDHYLALVGYTRDELVHERVRWDQLTAPEYRDRDARAVDEVRATGACGPYEKEYIRKDGTRLRVLVGGAALRNGRGECIGFAAALPR
jgi:PAS domain S-box-containing protein